MSDAYERDVRLAWITEYMARQKTLNQRSMDRLLQKRNRSQSPGEMTAMVEMLRQLHPRSVHKRVNES